MDLGDSVTYGGPAASSLIIAGDGNAYVAYRTQEGTAGRCTYQGADAGEMLINHLRLLRVSSSGAYDRIPVHDWNSCYQELNNLDAYMISNGDTGVLLTWEQDSIDESPFGMALTNGASSTVAIGAIAPGQQEAVTPVLQAQDGSFVGTVGTANGSFVQSMIAFDSSGNVRWTVPNETPQIATADGGVIGKSGTIYDVNGSATGEVQNPTAIPSWASVWYLGSSGISQLALPLVDLPQLDNTTGASLWGFVGGNPSQNGTAFLQCCSPSLAWVLGPTDHIDDPPDVVKTYALNNIACTKGPSQIISEMESTFGSFANFSGTFSYHHIPWAVTGTATFSGSVSLGNTISIHNVNVDSVTEGKLKTLTFDVKVQVTQVTSTSFTFTTLPGHVLYPATISFSATSPMMAVLSFAINVNGTFANKEAEAGYKGAGTYFEDKIWNHVLSQVKSSCSQ